MRKKLSVLLIVLALLGLCGCGRNQPSVSNPSGPGRMVRRIVVASHPENPDFDRTYVTQENMNGLLALLRSMETDETPDQEPDLEGGQSYYTATITFANGETSTYYLLGRTYLRLGSDPWCLVDQEQVMEFNRFLNDHPSDDGSVPVETTAAPTTVPTE